MIVSQLISKYGKIGNTSISCLLRSKHKFEFNHLKMYGQHAFSQSNKLKYKNKHHYWQMSTLQRCIQRNNLISHSIRRNDPSSTPK